MFNFGLLELVIVAVFAVILYGSTKLAKLSQGVSRSAKQVRNSLPGSKSSDKSPEEARES